jgi:GT2 family glycosyltransferase
MRICAIVLNYRNATKTAECLCSLTGQGIDTVIVVDNSADITSARQLSEALEAVRAAGSDFAVRVLTPEENLGFAKGVNLALQHDAAAEMPHDTYLLLNNDAQATPSLIRLLASALASDPQLFLVAPAIISRSGERQCGSWYHRYLGLLTNRKTALSFPYFTGCCLMFRGNLVESGKLFDEAFFMYGEDVELGWRLYREDKRTMCVEDAIVHHEGSSSSRKAGLFYEYYLAHTHLLLALRTWYSPLEIPLMMLGKLMALAARAIVRCARYRSLVPLATYMLAWFPLKIRTP